MDYREKLKEEARRERRGSDQVEWENKQELIYIQKYHREDKERLKDAKGRACRLSIDWDDGKEREARERMQKQVEGRKKKPVIWDLDKFGFKI